MQEAFEGISFNFVLFFIPCCIFFDHVNNDVNDDDDDDDNEDANTFL